MITITMLTMIRTIVKSPIITITRKQTIIAKPNDSTKAEKISSHNLPGMGCKSGKMTVKCNTPRLEVCRAAELLRLVSETTRSPSSPSHRRRSLRYHMGPGGRGKEDAFG